MALYSYRAIDSQNHTIESTTTALSKDELAADLEKRGLIPLSIRQVDQGLNTKQSLPTIEKITLCRYLSTMLKSGLSLTESISVVASEATHPVTKKILDDLNFGTQHGQSLSSIMARHPRSFDNFFLTIVKAGEVSGTLAEAFAQIEHQLRSEYQLRQKIQSALMYPAVVFLAMLGIGFLMFFFVLPQIGQVFLRLNLPLAPPVKILFSAVLYLNQYKFFLIGGVVLFIIFLVVFLKTRAGKNLVTKIFAPLPIIKNLIKQIDVARFCRIFSTLLKSGVPITQALEISLNSLSFPKYRQLTPTIIEQVSKGQTLASAFKTNQIFPALLTQMIASGEQTGSLDEALRDLGEFYEEEVETAVKKATELLEPILMLVVGIGVGLMVLAVITPIYSVVNSLQAGGTR